MSACAGFLLSFLITILIEWRLVPFLRAKRAGQPILEIGPSWHLSKSGTPTMGGIGFIAAMLLTVLLLYLYARRRGSSDLQKPLFILLFALCCGLVGVADDLCKLRQRQNKGLSAAQKYALQLAVSVAFLFAAELLWGLEKELLLPFCDLRVSLGIFYYPFALLYLTGLVNALNLTDGVDGLLSSLVGVIAALFVLLGVAAWGNEALLLGAALLGGTVGFLCFNAHPAKVFMGDTGSLFLGGVVAGYGLLSPSPLLVLLACGVFVVEAASVALQVIYFKLSKGKRLFRMAPLHHHFERLGWSEERVVAVFCAAGVCFAALALVGR